TNVNGTLYFVASDGTDGFQLWKSDGTNTTMITDIAPNFFFAEQLTNVNGTLFFTATDGVHGWELWTSDGTSNGTHMVQDIYPGSGGSFPLYLTNLKGTLYFAANDPVHGVELWKLSTKS